MYPKQAAESLSDVLAKELSARRLSKGLSKNETAARSGLAVSFVFDLENGKRRASVETLVKLAWVFETSASEILAKCEQEINYLSSKDSR